MSVTSNTNDKSQISVVEMLIFAGAAIAAAPLIVPCVAYMALVLKTNRKEKFVLYSCIGIIALLCTKIGLFLEETAHIAVTLIKGLLKHEFVISAYGHYSITSWVLLAAFSFAVASYAVKRIRYNRTLEEVGVSSLERKYQENGGKLYESYC